MQNNLNDSQRWAQTKPISWNKSSGRVRFMGHGTIYHTTHPFHLHRTYWNGLGLHCQLMTGHILRRTVSPCLRLWWFFRWSCCFCATLVAPAGWSTTHTLHYDHRAQGVFAASGSLKVVSACNWFIRTLMMAASVPDIIKLDVMVCWNQQSVNQLVDRQNILITNCFKPLQSHGPPSHEKAVCTWWSRLCLIDSFLTHLVTSCNSHQRRRRKRRRNTLICFLAKRRLIPVFSLCVKYLAYLSIETGNMGKELAWVSRASKNTAISYSRAHLEQAVSHFK